MDAVLQKHFVYVNIRLKRVKNLSPRELGRCVCLNLPHPRNHQTIFCATADCDRY